ncbi:hypothetical protein FRX31_022289 [Thalictrum thalictroides]|uniref:Uncharacterized protein n=1 Tax=Thalictrum thalictroides TaxID=46969 RepID=A0A7J6VSQ0_THATH|nr:hypothetical protein FRX31_022289 [Thalictrum thalictroides]
MSLPTTPPFTITVTDDDIDMEAFLSELSGLPNNTETVGVEPTDNTNAEFENLDDLHNGYPVQKVPSGEQYETDPENDRVKRPKKQNSAEPGEPRSSKEKKKHKKHKCHQHYHGQHGSYGSHGSHGRTLTVDDSAIADSVAALNLRLNSHLPRDLEWAEGKSYEADHSDVSALTTRISELEAQNSKLLESEAIKKDTKYQGSTSRLDSHKEAQNSKLLESERELTAANDDEKSAIANFETQIAKMKEEFVLEKTNAVQAVDKEMTARFEELKLGMDRKLNELLAEQKAKYLDQISILQNFIRKKNLSTPRNH